MRDLGEGRGRDRGTSERAPALPSIHPEYAPSWARSFGESDEHGIFALTSDGPCAHLVFSWLGPSQIQPPGHDTPFVCEDAFWISQLNDQLKPRSHKQVLDIITRQLTITPHCPVRLPSAAELVNAQATFSNFVPFNCAILCSGQQGRSKNPSWRHTVESRFAPLHVLTVDVKSRESALSTLEEFLEKESDDKFIPVIVIADGEQSDRTSLPPKVSIPLSPGAQSLLQRCLNLRQLLPEPKPYVPPADCDQRDLNQAPNMDDQGKPELPPRSPQESYEHLAGILKTRKYEERIMKAREREPNESLDLFLDDDPFHIKRDLDSVPDSHKLKEYVGALKQFAEEALLNDFERGRDGIYFPKL